MLNDEEKTAIRYYLGYPQVKIGAAISLGVPDASQLNFLLESGMNNLDQTAEKWVRRCIQELECIEDQLSSIRSSLHVEGVVGSVRLRSGEALEDLERQYRSWVSQLASQLGAVANPFNERLNLFGEGSSSIQEPYP